MPAEWRRPNLLWLRVHGVAPLRLADAGRQGQHLARSSVSGLAVYGLLRPSRKAELMGLFMIYFAIVGWVELSRSMFFTSMGVPPK